MHHDVVLKQDDYELGCDAQTAFREHQPGQRLKDLCPERRSTPSGATGEHLDRCNGTLSRRCQCNLIPASRQQRKAACSQIDNEEVDRTGQGVAGSSCRTVQTCRRLTTTSSDRWREHFPSRKKFQDVNHLRRGLTQLSSNPRMTSDERGIDLLPDRWQKCVRLMTDTLNV
ncbi:hypothetical protein KIN20_000097 [Parelaphostrongylus tenuis]|uniref:Uncharacterized protein n=1 Tax=Parelaphostrongylus tenuis TaxID=148309 RepID=A0AAD5QB85_PARTN|nr:hypothetical protein KIN20_000097 [Parelaphostrongylus tenuis]